MLPWAVTMWAVTMQGVSVQAVTMWAVTMWAVTMHHPVFSVPFQGHPEGLVFMVGERISRELKVTVGLGGDEQSARRYIDER